MRDGWYTKAKRLDPLTQGEIVTRYPLPVYQRGIEDDSRVDLIVMTHACDLANEKIRTVLVCPNLPLREYRIYWQKSMESRKQVPSQRAWEKQCKKVIDGDINNLLLLNSGIIGRYKIEPRLIDFREVYTIPRDPLEAFVRLPNKTRITLRSPYREYVSQAFAHLFMRVALPLRIDPGIADLPDAAKSVAEDHVRKRGQRQENR